MKNLTTGLVFIISLGFHQLYAQQDSLQMTKSDSIIVSSWMVGVGINIVDDSGDAWNDVFTVSDQWNFAPYPSRISLGRYFRNGLGIEGIVAYNRYKEGYRIDGTINPQVKDYYSVDSRVSYDLNKLFGETAWFDPYVGVGAGYTKANDIGRGTYNAVFGFRTWFSDHWGLDLNTSGKWSFGNEASNHIQHAAGVVYRFDIEKELSKKGKEKLALIQEQQRMADSIAAAKKSEEEARLLEEKMQREKEEAARLAAEENARQEAMKKRMEELQAAIDSLGPVHYRFNSHLLSDDAKLILKEISGILKANTDVYLNIEGHADSRGPAEYNILLSERRAAQAVEYLREQGISENQLNARGFGETRLLNTCADGVRCTAAQHAENRRAEFFVLEIQ